MDLIVCLASIISPGRSVDSKLLAFKEICMEAKQQALLRFIDARIVLIISRQQSNDISHMLWTNIAPAFPKYTKPMLFTAVVVRRTLLGSVHRDSSRS